MQSLYIETCFPDKNVLYDFLEDAIEAHKNNKTSEKNFVDYLLESDAATLPNAVTFFVAGFHTTALCELLFIRKQFSLISISLFNTN